MNPPSAPGSTAPLFERVAIVGIGLLGGSLGLALRERRLARLVTGYARRDLTLAECRERGAVDLPTRNLAQAVDGADLVVLCTPVSQMAPLVREILPLLRPGALLTDVGSVKAGVVAEIEPLCARSETIFVGSHPMAGSEKTGVLAARGDLFDGTRCVVTPTPRTPPAARAAIRRLWEAVGSEVVELSPAVHDDLVSRSSHLPHVIAATLARYVLSPAHARDQARLCATGFRDTTRIASGSPEMWRDIALANRAALSRVLEVFIQDLGEFQNLLAEGDPAALEGFFREAKARRDAWTQASRPTTE
jgi:prephenate dehydrogenase